MRPRGPRQPVRPREAGAAPCGCPCPACQAPLLLSHSHVHPSEVKITPLKKPLSRHFLVQQLTHSLLRPESRLSTFSPDSLFELCQVTFLKHNSICVATFSGQFGAGLWWTCLMVAVITLPETLLLASWGQASAPAGPFISVSSCLSPACLWLLRVLALGAACVLWPWESPGPVTRTSWVGRLVLPPPEAPPTPSLAGLTAYEMQQLPAKCIQEVQLRRLIFSSPRSDPAAEAKTLKSPITSSPASRTPEPVPSVHLEGPDCLWL